MIHMLGLTQAVLGEVPTHERLHGYVKKQNVAADMAAITEAEEVKRKKLALERSYSEHRKL